MVEVTLTLEYKGKNYRTNVIVKRGTPQSDIYCIAQEQIMKQWSK
ncbi:BA3454 family stress response protein [Bacillus sp. JJ1521]